VLPPFFGESGPVSRAPLLFKETDVVRAVKACRKAGIDVGRVEIDSSGKIVVIAKNQTDSKNDDKQPPTDLDAWLTRRRKGK
jgi:hypothetical protein